MQWSLRPVITNTLRNSRLLVILTTAIAESECSLTAAILTVCVWLCGCVCVCALITQCLPVIFCSTYECSAAVHGKLRGRETGRCAASWRNSGDNSGQRWIITHTGLRLLSHTHTHTHSPTHIHAHFLDYFGMQLAKFNTQHSFWISLKSEKLCLKPCGVQNKATLCVGANSGAAHILLMQPLWI